MSFTNSLDANYNHVNNLNNNLNNANNNKQYTNRIVYNPDEDDDVGYDVDAFEGFLNGFSPSPPDLSPTGDHGGQLNGYGGTGGFGSVGSGGSGGSSVGSGVGTKPTYNYPRNSNIDDIVKKLGSRCGENHFHVLKVRQDLWHTIPMK